MLRRQFIAGAATFALSARPLRAHAQQSATRRTRIGILIYGTPERNPSTQALLEGFRQLGYVDGQNVTIEYRYAQGRPERLPELAADLVQSKPVVIFALGGDVTPHVAKATQSIPIIYAMSADPVQLGIAKSLAKPGGNATGVTFLSDQLAAKRLETFKEAAPRIARVALVRDPSHADNELPIAERAAKALKLELLPVEIHDPSELDRTLETAKEVRHRQPLRRIVAAYGCQRTAHRRVCQPATPAAGGWMGCMGPGRRLDLLWTQCRGDDPPGVALPRRRCSKAQIPAIFRCSNRHGLSCSSI